MVHHTLPSHKPLDVTEEMLQKARTVFRVVGGYDQHPGELARYHIIPYLLIHTTAKFYTTSRNGKVELQHRRITTNSEWYEDIDDALVCIQNRIADARKTIADSCEVIQDERSISQGIYVIKFRQEFFKFYVFSIINKTSKGFKIDEKFRGLRYLYDRDFPPNKPHDEDRPFEMFRNEDLDYLKKQIQGYADERLRYLNRANREAIEFVKLFKEKLNGQENG